MPILAVFATVLIGASALAIDIGVNTHTKRSLQNVSDAAALTGARDLDTAPVTQSERIQGAEEAIEVLHTRLQWPLSMGQTVVDYATQAVGAAAGCQAAGTSCSITLAPTTSLQIVVNTPPRISTNTDHHTDMYFEVQVRQSSANGLGVTIGLGTSTETARSVAYHFAPNQSFGFALFAQENSDDSNHAENIVGNIYGGREVNAQSNGQASTCANGGSIVLGSPQYPNPYPNPDPYSGLFQQFYTHAPVIQTSVTCPTSNGNGMVGQTQPEGCANVQVDGVTMDTTNSYTDDTAITGSVSPTGSSVGNTKACIVDPPLSPPDLQAPPLPQTAQQRYGCGGGLDSSSHTYMPGLYTCGMTINANLQPGIYEVQHNSSLAADVTFGSSAVGTCNTYQQSLGLRTGTDICLHDVTFMLESGGSPSAGAIISLSTNGRQVSITPYDSGSSDPNDGRFAVYAQTGTTAQVLNNAPQSLLAFQGTVYMPSGTMSSGSNGAFYVDGQVIVYSYITHGGNHFAAEISYNGGLSAVQREVLRLVE